MPICVGRSVVMYRLIHKPLRQDTMSQKRNRPILELQEKPVHSVGPVAIYRLILLVVVICILATSVAVSRQTQERHETYRTLQILKRDLATMQIEQERLLIEQQTFSATPQVAKRAVDELGMFFPSNHHKKIISPTYMGTEIQP